METMAGITFWKDISRMKLHSDFQLNGISYTQSALLLQAEKWKKDTHTHWEPIGEFLLKWFDFSDNVVVKTSGSTGIPKEIFLSKNSMKFSALNTVVFFDLKPRTNALLCLPVSFIAGKMMLLRGMLSGWHLTVVKPSSKPLENLEKAYDFCAMTPMQVAHSLDDFNIIKMLIIGGAPLHQELINSLLSHATQSYETYGMTETITHIAIRNISSGESYFKPMSGISVGQDERGCLEITASYLSNSPIQTNDIVTIRNNTFKWLGRYDNVINSGGIKLIPEQIEKKLEKHLLFRYFITAIDDDVLGQKPVLVIAQESFDLNRLNHALKKLPKIERPWAIYYTAKFSELESGKVDKAMSFQCAQKCEYYKRL